MIGQRHMLLGAFALNVLLFMSPVRADPGECEHSVRENLTALSKAYADADLDVMMEFYSDYFNGLQPPFTKSELREEASRMLRASTGVSVAFDPIEIKCADTLASVITRVRFSQTLKRNESVIERNVVEQILFEKQEGRWRILWFYEVEKTADTPRVGEVYRVPDTQFQVKLPDGFQYRFGKVNRAATVLFGVSDDLRRVITFRGTDLNVRIKPDQLAHIAENQIRFLFPDCKVVSPEVDHILELPAVRIDTECPQFKRSSMERAVLIMHDQSLFSMSLSDIAGDDSGRLKDAFRAVTETIRLSAEKGEPTEKSAPSDGVYRNDEYGLSMTFPDRWSLEFNRNNAMVESKSPSGSGTIRLFVSEVLEDHDPVELIAGDDATTRKLVENFTCCDPGELCVGTLCGAQSVSTFDLAEPVKRLRAYFVQDNRLFLVVCDVQPAEDYDEFEPLFRKTIQSMRVDPDRTKSGR